MKEKIKKEILQVLAETTPNWYCDLIFRKHKHATFKNLEKLKLKAEPLLLKYLLTKNDKLFDIGAHVGEFIYCAQRSIPPKNIYAFEPNTSRFKVLKKSFRHSNTFNIALSSENGLSEFKVPIINNKAQTARGTLRTAFKEKDEQGAIIFTVHVQTIDSFVKEQAIETLALIKVDTEGTEMDIIKGAENTIKEQRPILILELEKRHLGGSINPAIQKINKFGYHCYFYDSDSMSIKQVTGDADTIQLDKYHKVNPVRYVNNFIFLPQDTDHRSKILHINRSIANER